MPGQGSQQRLGWELCPQTPASRHWIQADPQPSPQGASQTIDAQQEKVGMDFEVTALPSQSGASQIVQ